TSVHSVLYSAVIVCTLECVCDRHCQQGAWCSIFTLSIRINLQQPLQIVTMHTRSDCIVHHHRCIGRKYTRQSRQRRLHRLPALITSHTRADTQKLSGRKLFLSLLPPLILWM